jgi:hypothetical protein
VAGLPRYIRGYEAFVLTPLRRNEGFFIFCAGFRAGACIDYMHAFSAKAVLFAVRMAPIQLFRRPRDERHGACIDRPGNGR